jgi:hypothetical protein
MSNPYEALLLQSADSIASLRPDDLRRKVRPDEFEHWDPRNEWVYAEMANYVLVGAFACHHLSGSGPPRKALLGFCAAFFDELVRAGADDRWFHRGARMGDPNIDRFTLLPLLEAFRLMEPDLPPPLKERILARVKGVLDVQYREYGSGKKQDVPDGPYPNMDVYYCLIMWHGHCLTGDQRYASDFSRYLDMLREAQFEDGGWTYYRGTNECPIYHDINVLLMSRIAALSGDERAWTQVRRSAPYYPLVVDRNGVPEYHTDCWWKHPWDAQLAFAPDTVASVTGDGQNRWIGDRVRARTLASTEDLFAGRNASIDNIMGLFAFYAASRWKDVTPVAPPEEQVRYDANIEGPRGRFQEWSWAATARYGSDTLVGAVATGSGGSALRALMAVTPEIPYWTPGGPFEGTGRMNLCVTPPDTCGVTTMGKDRAEFTVTYPMACTRHVFTMEAFPRTWQCSQHWVLDSHRLCGTIQITSQREQISRPPAVRVRFGKDGEFVRLSDTEYSYAPFTFRIHRSDFPHRRIQPAPVMLCLKKKDAVELLLRGQPNDDERNYRSGQTFGIELEIGVTSGQSQGPA